MVCLFLFAVLICLFYLVFAYTLIGLVGLLGFGFCVFCCEVVVLLAVLFDLVLLMVGGFVDVDFYVFR